MAIRRIQAGDRGGVIRSIPTRQDPPSRPAVMGDSWITRLSGPDYRRYCHPMGHTGECGFHAFEAEDGSDTGYRIARPEDRHVQHQGRRSFRGRNFCRDHAPSLGRTLR